MTMKRAGSKNKCPALKSGFQKIKQARNGRQYFVILKNSLKHVCLALLALLFKQHCLVLFFQRGFVYFPSPLKRGRNFKISLKKVWITFNILFGDA